MNFDLNGFQWFCFHCTEPSLIDHCHQWFFNSYPQIFVSWSTVVLACLKDLKKLAIATYPILWQMHLMIEKGNNRSQGHSRVPTHAILQSEDKVKTVWTFRTTFCYRWKISMVPKSTIGFNGFGVSQPVISMVVHYWSANRMVTCTTVEVFCGIWQFDVAKMRCQNCRILQFSQRKHASTLFSLFPRWKYQTVSIPSETWNHLSSSS